MLSENDLRNVLDEYALEAQSAEGPDTAAVRDRIATVAPKRTHRRRRSLGLAPLASAAAVVAVAVGVAVASQSHGTNAAPAPPLRTQTAAAVSPVTSPATTHQPRTSAKPVARPSTVTVTPQWMARTLLRLLPPGGRVTALGGHSEDNSVYAGFNYDDGHGIAGVGISITFPTVSSGPLYETYCRPDEIAGTNPPPRCTSITSNGPPPQCLEPSAPSAPCGQLLPGSQVYEDSTDEARLIPGWQPHPGAPDVWTVALLRPDGLDIEIDLQNGPIDRKYDITRDTPLLTEPQMLAIAADKVWSATISAEAAQSATRLFTPARTQGSLKVPVAYSR